jgi:hypothetical protein
MATQNPQPTRQGPSKTVQDLPGCIKYILLFFLILLLLAEIYSGEFRKFPDWSWIIWLVLLIKLLLIAILIWLIKVQKDLKCQITAPTSGSCVKEESDILSGKVFVRIKGTASGSVFGHYTLEVTRDGDPPIAGIVTYPAGGGGVPVTSGYAESLSHRRRSAQGLYHELQPLKGHSSHRPGRKDSGHNDGSDGR